MGWQPEPDGGAGEGPDRGSGAPSRDPRLERFAGDGTALGPVPSGALVKLLDELSGRERRAEGATGNELSGMLRFWAAVESWAAAGKLGTVREMMRRDAEPTPGAGHGDLPEEWSASMRHDLALSLACSVQAAESAAWLAWELGARLPGIDLLLGEGILTVPKARVVAETFRNLTDADAAKAEALILAQLAGKTYMQVLRLAEQAALTVDPGLAERRRAQARRNARVSLFREEAGTAGLAGRDLPPDEALAAMAAVNARAETYLSSEAFGETRMDVLRAQAYLDLLNEVPAEARIAATVEFDELADIADLRDWARARAARDAAAADPGPGDECDDDNPSGAGPSCEGPDAGSSGPGDHGSGGPDAGDPAPSSLAPSALDSNGPSPSDPESGGPDSAGPAPQAGSPVPAGGPLAEDPLARRQHPTDLIVPLATLLGLAERPGEIQGFGLLDPGLARDLAAAATAGPGSEICVTVTSPEGYAIGHGCARPERRSRDNSESAVSLIRLAARLNLTISATDLPDLVGQVGPWAFTPRGSPDPPGQHGTWTLAIPGGRRFTVRLDPVPVFDCDHAHETSGYRPSDKLRHLVQVRDGTCTFPSCNRHARESDFEHALPYDKGGRTCACNAGARSRACHRVKQTEGWHVTQPQPGWHRWETPSGRIYTQEPKRYPT